MGNEFSSVGEFIFPRSQGEAMSLPKWVEDELSRWSSKHGKGYLNLFKALSIAWEALEQIYEGTTESDILTAKEAMRRISEMEK